MGFSGAHLQQTASPLDVLAYGQAGGNADAKLDAWCSKSGNRVARTVSATTAHYHIGFAGRLAVAPLLSRKSGQPGSRAVQPESRGKQARSWAVQPWSLPTQAESQGVQPESWASEPQS